MASLRRTYVVPAMLAASLCLNLAFVASLARSGGLRRIFLRMDLAELPKDRKDFQKEAEERFRGYPNTPGEVVFVGDSLVAGGPWSEFYGEIKNRGIGGDTASAVMGRIAEVTESRPRQVFLLVGTNDLAASVPIPQYIRHYRALLARIREDSPGTTINVLGIFPVNPTMPTKPTYTNEQIAEANRRLKQLAGETPGARFLDLTPHLVDRDGNLRAEFTTDGIHLTPAAYLAIREPLAGLLPRDEAQPTPRGERP